MAYLEQTRQRSAAKPVEEILTHQDEETGRKITSLGATIWLAWETLRTEELYVALFTTALLGIGFNRSLQWCEQTFMHWQ